ncbi:hypothetical protein CO178_00610 [candidate division WWE3 bacterium CG_4_9_14_3_um_filter_34_6]|uniref:Uncharacterized protein n=1 Tax=candidate division WWE3 bacterium CG_4_9_14_3_um_filter_34_6 TaxID=1975079 RepID=A0A2M7X526_UNCKA|nr:MAG: hypothetical protein CO178_00610 [candidate division WWE3 bacterium CG_4_9_14_3_um_filter_34_6]
MKNWSTNTKRLKKNLNDYAIWKLEQKINFGLDGEKLPEKDLRKYFNGLSVDPLKKLFLKQLLWPIKY